MTSAAKLCTRRAFILGLVAFAGCSPPSSAVDEVVDIETIDREPSPDRDVDRFGPFEPVLRLTFAELETLESEQDSIGIYVQPARAWVIRVDAEASVKLALSSDATLAKAAADGWLVLSQSCPDEGCRVPSCGSSEFFECPCSGSLYTRFGEHHRGPTPRGMDRLRWELDDESLTIFAEESIAGLARDVRPSGEQPAGQQCIGPAEE